MTYVTPATPLLGEVKVLSLIGTKTTAGPVDTVRFTAEPAATDVPAIGDSEMTLPAATVDDDCKVTVPTISPAPVRVVVAAA